MVAPGRTASGEAFAYDRLEFTTDLIAEGRLVVRERYFLGPDNEALRSLRRHFPNAYYASAFVVTPSAASESFQREISEFHQGSVAVGASRPVENVCAIKVVASDSISLRAAVTHMRRLAYAHLEVRNPLFESYRKRNLRSTRQRPSPDRSCISSRRGMFQPPR